MEVIKSKKLSLKEKVSYGFGDLGNGLMFDLGQIYLLKFFTDILGISAYMAGLVFLISKIFDAVADSAVGAWIDSRMNISKRGKFRPFILFGSIPLAIATVLTFLNLDIVENGKIAYAFATYMLFGLAYSVVNIPYGSLASVMTKDPVERASLASFRTIGSQVALLITGVAVIPIVMKFSDPETGYVVAVIAMVLLGIVAHYICYRNTKENIVKVNKNEKLPLAKIFKSLLTNRPLIGLCAIALFTITAGFLKLSVQLFYVQYSLHDPKLMPIIMFLSIGFSLVGTVFVPSLVRKIGKKNTFIIGLIIIFVGDVANFILPVNLTSFLVFASITYIGSGIVASLPWVMIADVMDYHEWKTGQRSEGIVYSSYSFFRKLAQALAGFIPGVALGIIGYIPNIEQSEQTLMGLKSLFFLVPSGLYVLAAIVLIFIYNLSDKLYKQIMVELENK